MKHMKKAISLLLALVMALALATTAAGAVQTVTNDSSHTYKAYQIFSGTQAEGEATLVDVQWGRDIVLTTTDGGDVPQVLTYVLSYGGAFERENPIFRGGLFDVLYSPSSGSLGFESIFGDCSRASDYAAVLGNYADNSAVADAFARIVWRSGDIKTGGGTVIPAGGSANLDSGYYLIVDTTETIGDDDARNLNLLQVTNKGAITIADKAGVPTVEKFVCERSKSDFWINGTWGKSADVGINNPVWFRLVGTLPSHYDNFLTYKYVFHDTLSAGITLSEERVAPSPERFFAFYLDANADVKATYQLLPHDDDEPAPPVPEGWHYIDRQDYTIGRDDTRDADGNQNFTVTFENLKTISGITKDSKIVVYYCADLNENAVIGLDGNTNKVKLEYSNDPNYAGTGTQTTSFTAEDMVRVFTYELDITKIDGATANNADPTTLSGAQFRLYFMYDTDADPSTPPLKRYIAPSDSSSSNNGFLMIAGEEVFEQHVDDTFNWTVGTDGKLVIKGLDAGTYYLEEMQAPAGYNTLTEPIKIEIGRTLDMATKNPTGNALSALNIKVDNGAATNGDLTTGILTISVANYAGATLPETGGIGTTLFYVIGGVLVAGAAVVLITRKRVRDEA